MRVFIYVFLALFLVGCAPKSTVDNYRVVSEFKDEEFLVEREWYIGYQEFKLNELVSLGLKNNSDLKLSALNIASAMARAGLVEADLYPTLSGSLSGESGRDISVQQEWRDSFNSNIMASYEVDLYGKIRDSVNSANWDVVASEFDMESVKLNLVNSIVDSYFKALFINDSLRLLDENLQNYKKLYAITKAKRDYGRDSGINLLELNKSILNLESKILSYKKDRERNLELLRNLLNLKPEESLKLESLNLESLSLRDVAFQGVDLSVPSYAISNRPDLRKGISSINSAFYNYKVSQKNFYPSLSLGASLTASSDSFRGITELDFLSGSVRLNLPFLDYKRLKENLKIKEIEFEKRVVEYERALIKALNEVSLYYKEYEISLTNLALFEDILKNSQSLSKLYLDKYNYGNAELKDYLDAKNSEISARINLLNEKYKTLNSEILIYKAMAGKFRSF
ncbi:MAG: TolC family protein [Campylobacteraceae bacterium]|nr:TolC family protein [Campylobacteraceae bacterium]